MLTKTLPRNADELLRWQWSDFEPLYQELNQRRLTTENIEIWLADWSHVEDAAWEKFNRLYYLVTANTADDDVRKQYEDLLNNFMPPLMEAENRLQKQLLESGLEVPGLEVQIKAIRTQTELFRQENLALLAEEATLAAEYDRIVGAQTVQWNGEEITIPQLSPLMQSPDREERERAWRAGTQRQLADRGAINALWQKLLGVRRQIAANAGFPDYRAFRWLDLRRFDYTPEDNLSFLDAIEAVVVPATERIYARRRARLGVESLRPWDLDVDPLDRPALRPFETTAELIEKARVVFDHVHPDLGEYFGTMVKENLLDLENRKNKGPGAYCTEFPAIQRPFIFANAVGLHDDLQTILHETGHAFHVFESSHLPYHMQREYGSEIAEVASMAMELLAGRFLDVQPGGFYSSADANRARVQHLEGCLLFWPYMAVVDSFQHWVYLHPDEANDPAQCDAQWAKQWERFMRGVDWSGLDDERVTGWHRKLHIHTIPFYYIEYGLAQLGAAQVWMNSLKNPAGAVTAYRRALSLGASRPLPQLFEAAGARLAFDAETLQEAVSTMESMIANLDAEQPPAAV
jgi:oligoendopeptidase F